MSDKPARLKDIADSLHISATTVHRALTGKDGVSDQLRKIIREKAAELGYSTNLAASALKRKHLQIGVLLPEPMMDNRFYYASLWSGVHQFMEENGTFFASLKEFYYPLLPDAHGKMLKDIYENHLEELDGLITLGVDQNQSAYFMEKLHRSGLPVIILGADLFPDSRLCCVKAFDEMSGSLAAELLTAFLPAGFCGSILLTGNPIGETGMIDQYRNLEGFQDYICRYAPGITLHSAYCADIQQLEGLLAPYLSHEQELPFAIYACSARHTARMCHLMTARGLTGKLHLIGNDSFPESIQAIRSGIMTATIDKKISRQSYTAAQILLEYLTYNKYPERSLIQIRPEILMRSNCQD